jgi:hypothetical protein
MIRGARPSGKFMDLAWRHLIESRLVDERTDGMFSRTDVACQNAKNSL